MKKIANYFIASYKGHTARTWVGIFASFIDSIGTSVAIFLALYLSTVLNLPAIKVGFIISAFGVGSFIGPYVGGYFCDKYDYYKVAVVMLLASGAMTSLIPIFSSFILLLIVVTLSGLFYGIFKPANSLILFGDAPVTDRARINGLYRVAINLGMGVASLVGGILAYIYFPLVFWFDGITSMIAAGILIYFNEPSQNVRKCSVQKQKKTSVDKIFVTLCLLLFINCLVFFQLRAAYPLYLNDAYQISATLFGYMFLLNCIMIVLFEVPLLNAVKDLNQMLIAMSGSILLCLSMFILPFGNNLIWAIVSCLLLTLGEILLFSTMMTLILDRAKENNKGRTIGVYQSMFALASMIAPALGSYIYSKSSPTLLWYGCGLIGLASFVIFQSILIKEMYLYRNIDNA